MVNIGHSQLTVVNQNQMNQNQVQVDVRLRVHPLLGVPVRAQEGVEEEEQYTVKFKFLSITK